MRRILRPVLASLFLAATPALPAYGQEAAPGASPVRLPGHVLSALPKAKRVPATRELSSAEPIGLTVVLRRSDPAGYERYLREVYDPGSGTFRRFLTPREVSDRFGPTPEDYAAVQAHFESHGLTVTEGSANRLTLTLRGSRAETERALAVTIGDYALGERVFHANESDPALPAAVAPKVEAIAGLSSLGRPRPVGGQEALSWACVVVGGFALRYPIPSPLAKAMFWGICTWWKWAAWCWTDDNYMKTPGYQIFWPLFDSLTDWISAQSQAARSELPAPRGAVTGAGQRVGILAYDSFRPSDVADWLSLFFHSTDRLANVSSVHVDGGATLGTGQSEVLLDIGTVLAVAPGAQVVVYDAPSSTSWQALFNAMINGGVTIISNSWASCESQMAEADVRSLDTVLSAAAASGISVLNASGDRGSTCLDGSADTAHVPASCPSATAVGGATLTAGPGVTFGGASWWDGSTGTPPGGRGGFGVSRYFARPSYQDGHVASPMRSVPDLVALADPNLGMLICQADDGGCPTGRLYAGTSMAAPAWAGLAALLNEGLPTNIGSVNAALYPLAGTSAFHDATAMGSDFAHVGLGLANANHLHQKLRGQAPGLPTASGSLVSSVIPADLVGSGSLDLPADGSAGAGVQVTLLDASGHVVGGKSVSLSASPGSHAVIVPASAVTSANDGTAVFTVTDLTAETVTFTATDTTDGIVLDQTATITFGVPPAASGSINGSVTTAPADGVTPVTITIELRDALDRPAPGKRVRLSQGGGHSVVSGPTPAVTDAAGKIELQATDMVEETVVYTAEDETDGLPVPGSATVTFTGGTISCVATPPTAAPGWAVMPFANGFLAQDFYYSGITFIYCPGASNPAFDDQSGAWVSDAPTGNLYRLPSTGGAASSGDVVATVGQTLNSPSFAPDGRLYAARWANGSGPFSGEVAELDRDTGAVVRTLASSLFCPIAAVDPLSGDVFYSLICFGGGAENPKVYRVLGTSGATLSVVEYASLPYGPAGGMSFGPDGTLYVAYGMPPASVARIGGTDTPQPASVTTVPGLTTRYSVTVAETQAGGAAKSLLVHDGTTLKLVDVTTAPPYTETDLAYGSDLDAGVIGPDGCLYSTGHDTIYRISPASGSCAFRPSGSSPQLTLSPSAVAPGPTQGDSVAFTATFRNVTVPAGTPVSFAVEGANAQVRLTQTDAAGSASVTLRGVAAGRDEVVATGVPSPTATALISNEVAVDWAPGPHVTWLTLSPSPTSGKAGAATTLVAGLYDVSERPVAAVVGQTVVLSVGGQSCSGVTGPDGLASCALSPTRPGVFPLTAAFAGSGSLVASSDAGLFTVTGAAATLYRTLTPCRVVETRGADGPLGGPALTAGQTRVFAVAGSCGIPATAVSISGNLTVVEPLTAGYLGAYPSDMAAILNSRINFQAGQTRANNAILFLSGDGSGGVAVLNGSGGAAHFILDVNGWFE